MAPTDAPIDPVARARACLGARFRLQGRDPAHGLDCVGLVARAFALPAVPAGYPLRGGRPEAIVARIEAAGFVADPVGALLLMRAGPHQHHLAIATGTGIIHADARLRRVVETPGAPPWPVLGRWARED